MKSLAIIFSVFISPLVNAQLDHEFTIFGGGTTSYLNFKEFNTFVETYNQQNSASLTKNLKYDPLGFGGQLGMGYRLGWFHSSISASYSRTLTSKARINDQERGFFFKNYLFDLSVGVCLTKKKLKFIPHANMTISSLNLESFYKYENGEKSFGTDSRYSGVYTSFKVTATLGLKTTLDYSDKIKFYVDFSFFPQAKKYGGGSFDTSGSGTDISSFPKSAFITGYVGVDDAMTERYRQFFLHLGVSYTLFKGNI
jgi:hypothetical protein